MTVFFFIINYKADDHTLDFLNSIRAATSFPELWLSINVIDNSAKSDAERELFEKQIHRFNAIFYSTGGNLGYFGCIPIAQRIIAGSKPDFIIYCNPDLHLADDFFVELRPMKSFRGIIAPAIIVEGKGFDQNPLYMKRLSKNKLTLLKAIFSNYALGTLYLYLSILKEYLKGIPQQQDKKIKYENCEIFAPHGAMFIFSDISFFKGLFQYPCFLFGEEIFIGEEAKKMNVNIVYKPKVKVYDTRHGSTSSLRASFIRELTVKSIDYLLEKYY